MADVALLGSPRSFMAKSSNFSGSGRKTVVTPLRLEALQQQEELKSEEKPITRRSKKKSKDNGIDYHY
jgi:hypothetical protein